jgi:hypothetical protein
MLVPGLAPAQYTLDAIVPFCEFTRRGQFPLLPAVEEYREAQLADAAERVRSMIGP